MLIAFAPNFQEQRDDVRATPGSASDARTATASGRSHAASPRTSGRILGRLAAASWLGLAAYFLLYAEPGAPARLAPELVALLVLAGWAFVLAALVHHAGARSERRRLQRRSRALRRLLERVDPDAPVRSSVRGERGPTVH